MRREWTWRVGAQAAEHHVRWWKYQMAAALLLIPAIALEVLALSLHAIALGLMSMAIFFSIITCMVMGGVEMRRQHNASCDALNLPKGSRDVRFPTQSSFYLKICERRKMQPYPFKPKDGMQDHGSEVVHR